MKKLIFILLASLFMASNVCAQTYAQEELAKQRAAERVAQMNDYVSFMASKEKNLNYRRYYKNKALNLFIGKGYDYNRDGYWKRVHRHERKMYNKRRRKCGAMEH